MMRKWAFLILSLVSLVSCVDDDHSEETEERLMQVLTEASNGVGPQYFQLPSSTDYDAIPQDPRNQITTEKVNLGQLLFHESSFGLEGKFPNSVGTYSCASCHHAAAGFQAGLPQGLGEGGLGFGIRGELRLKNEMCEDELIDVQPIRSPSILNGAYQPVTLWNGQFGATHVNEGTEDQWELGTPKEVNRLGYEGLESQAIEGLKVHRMKFDAEIIESHGYKDAFDQAFSDIPIEDRYSRITAGLAIAAYERTVMANESPFQQYLQGDRDALTLEEKGGALLFFKKAECVACHTGPGLNDMNFYALGMNEFDPSSVFRYDVTDPTRFGRFSFTQREEDRFKFKTPQLYNLKDVDFLGHGASFKTVKEVIEYKNFAEPENPEVTQSQLANEFQPIGLSRQEIDLITKFIVNGLYDSNLERYAPDALISGNCFPNNDIGSRTDLGCE